MADNALAFAFSFIDFAGNLVTICAVFGWKNLAANCKCQPAADPGRKCQGMPWEDIIWGPWLSEPDISQMLKYFAASVKSLTCWWCCSQWNSSWVHNIVQHGDAILVYLMNSHFHSWCLGRIFHIDCASQMNMFTPNDSPIIGSRLNITLIGVVFFFPMASNPVSNQSQFSVLCCVQFVLLWKRPCHDLGWYVCVCLCLRIICSPVKNK